MHPPLCCLSSSPLDACSHLLVEFPNSGRLQSANPWLFPLSWSVTQNYLAVLVLCLRMALRVFAVGAGFPILPGFHPLPCAHTRLLMTPHSRPSEPFKHVCATPVKHSLPCVFSEIRHKSYHFGGGFPCSFPDDCSIHWPLINHAHATLVIK